MSPNDDKSGRIRLDEAFLVDVHLEGLPPEEGKLMLAHIYETLEQRVGFRLAAEMSPEEFDEFELLFEEQDDEKALAWLNEKFPDHGQVVREELNLLRAEIRQIAPSILSLGGIEVD